MGLNVIGVDAKQKFYDAACRRDRSRKRSEKHGNAFIEVFDEESK